MENSVEENERRPRDVARDRTIIASSLVIDAPSSFPRSDTDDLLEEWSPEGSTVSQEN